MGKILFEEWKGDFFAVPRLATGTNWLPAKLPEGAAALNMYQKTEML